MVNTFYLFDFHPIVNILFNKNIEYGITFSYTKWHLFCYIQKEFTSKLNANNVIVTLQLDLNLQGNKRVIATTPCLKNMNNMLLVCFSNKKR